MQAAPALRRQAASWRRRGSATTYDPVGNELTSTAYGDTTGTIDYAYDALGRETTETVPGTSIHLASAARLLMDDADGRLDAHEAGYATAQLRFHRGQLLLLEGALQEAGETLDAAEVLAREDQDVETEMLACYWHTEIDLLSLDPGRALDRLEDVIEDRIPTRSASNVTERLLMMQLGLAYGESGDVSKASLARSLCQEAVDYFRRYQYVLYLIFALQAQGRILVALDQPAAALPVLNEALELVDVVSHRWAQLSTLWALAAAEGKLGRPGPAEVRLARAMQLANDMGAPRLVPLLEAATRNATSA